MQLKCTCQQSSTVIQSLNVRNVQIEILKSYLCDCLRIECMWWWARWQTSLRQKRHHSHRCLFYMTTEVRYSCGYHGSLPQNCRLTLFLFAFVCFHLIVFRMISSVITDACPSYECTTCVLCCVVLCVGLCMWARPHLSLFDPISPLRWPLLYILDRPRPLCAIVFVRPRHQMAVLTIRD